MITEEAAVPEDIVVPFQVKLRVEELLLKVS
jgi:hypothetical protein